MDSRTKELISHIELQAEMISKDVIEIVTKLQSRVDDAKDYTKQSTDCFNDAVAELFQEVNLIVESTSNLVRVMQEISLDMEAVDRLRTQIQGINVALDTIEKKL